MLRYFPIIPRLQKNMAKETSSQTQWHKEERKVEENVLRHPADGEAWDHFDKMFGWYVLNNCEEAKGYIE